MSTSPKLVGGLRLVPFGPESTDCMCDTEWQILSMRPSKNLRTLIAVRRQPAAVERIIGRRFKPSQIDAPTVTPPPGRIVLGRR